MPDQATKTLPKVTPIGEPRQVKILSAKAVEVTGKNGQVQTKTVVNGMFWALGIIPEDHTFLTVQDFFLNDEKGAPTTARVVNVLGSTGRQAALTTEEKVATILGADASYSNALALLLK
jgi:hypothetical protein